MQALNASSKRKQQTQATNASTNGGDASRVGILRQKFTDKRVISAACEPVCMNLCLNARRETRRPH